jgi:hypothetical protein
LRFFRARSRRAACGFVAARDHPTSSGIGLPLLMRGDRPNAPQDITGKAGRLFALSLWVSQALLQLRAGHRLLLAPLLHERPKLTRMTQFDLFQVESLDPNEQSDRLVFAHQDDAVVLSVTDAFFQVGLFDSDDFHRTSSVVW